MKRKFIQLAALVGLVGFVASANAADFNASDSFGSSVTIVNNSGTLQITLSTTRDATSFGSVLTALFFNVADNPTLAPLSATTSGTLVGTGSPLLNPFTGNVGGEWEYIGGGGTLAFGASQGISSTGLDIFGEANFGGPNLYGPTAVDGGQFGIVGSLDDANKALLASLEVQNSVTFTLSGVPTGFDPSTGISGVTFFYGTSLNEVPDAGSTLVLLGFALVGADILRRKIRKA